MDHDRLFKQLLTTFFFEFIDLFLPAVAKYLSRDKVEFLDKEIFTDLAGGERHEVDIVARCRFKGGGAFFLIHVEDQAKAQSRYPRQMFLYFAKLHEKYDLPTYPVTLFTYDRPKRAEAGRYVVSFPDKAVLDFRFTAIQLNRLDWKHFAGRDNPVAAALMAKMRIGPRDRPVVKLACVRMILRLPLKPARRALVQQFVDSYLHLSKPERKRYEREVAKLPAPEKEKVMTVMNEWAEEALKKGIRKGRKEATEAVVSAFLNALRAKIGDLPAELERRVRKLPPARLGALGGTLSSLSSAADLNAWLARET